MIQVPSTQVPGVYHRRIGDIVVTALSDGYLDGTMEVMQNITPADATQLLTDKFRPGRRTSVNCYLVYSAGRLALIETGSGDYLLPTAGKLQRHLKAAGLPRLTVRGDGSLVIMGSITAKTALLLTAIPARLVATAK